ncbi:hypothetical protein O181_066434 [Austropuccinia psidii MF-1]|uniref:Uncharacterized protein n=1 Tax=Austropuccinia psidii MF-1 TaxID=1389203 RepID=A0A9Q3I5J5_9BASI|nr:hypothetical protein [Austropuccinia psidii MF-1]
MEATIQSNKMDGNKEEARPNPEVLNLPQERHIWRIPEFPPITQGEYHRTLRRLEPIVLKRQSQKEKELVEEPKYFIHRPEEGVGNNSSFGDRRPSGVYQLQKCLKTSPNDLRRSREEPRTIKVREKAKPIGTDLTHKGAKSPNWNLQLWTVSSIWPGILSNSQPKIRKG